MYMPNILAPDLQQLDSRNMIPDKLGGTMSTFSEQRSKPRVACDYQAIVVGTDQKGKAYKENATLANLSAGGLYMWVNRVIERDSSLSVTVVLSSNLVDIETSKLATKGIVVRTEPQANGICGVAVKFSQYRFI
jgi:hypothetical protein